MTLSPDEQRAWEEIVRRLGEPNGPARVNVEGPSRETLGQVIRGLLKDARERLRGVDAVRDPADSAESKDYRLGAAAMVGALVVATVAAAIGIVRGTDRSGEEPPVAFIELSAEDQLAVERAMLNSGFLLVRTGTCEQELNVVADRARGSLPSPEELRAGAARASEFGALCLPDSSVGSGYVIQVNGTRVLVDGDTLLGESNNAENLCSTSGWLSLEQRARALPPGSVEQEHVRALIDVVQTDCPPAAQ